MNQPIHASTVTVLTYLHGVKEAQISLKEIQEQNPGVDIDLIELRSLKPLDMDTIRASLQRTHKVAILDESTLSGGVGATISAIIGEQCYYELDAPVRRLCMEDAPVLNQPTVASLFHLPTSNTMKNKKKNKFLDSFPSPAKDLDFTFYGSNIITTLYYP